MLFYPDFKYKCGLPEEREGNPAQAGFLPLQRLAMA